MVLIGETREVELAMVIGEYERDVLGLLHVFGLKTPEYDKIAAAAYGSVTLSPRQVVSLRAETDELLRAYLSRRKAEIQREKHVHAQSPRVLESILDGLLANDPWRAKLGEILDLCDEATAGGTTIHFVGG